MLSKLSKFNFVNVRFASTYFKVLEQLNNQGKHQEVIDKFYKLQNLSIEEYKDCRKQFQIARQRLSYKLEREQDQVQQEETKEKQEAQQIDQNVQQQNEQQSEQQSEQNQEKGEQETKEILVGPPGSNYNNPITAIKVPRHQGFIKSVVYDQGLISILVSLTFLCGTLYLLMIIFRGPQSALQTNDTNIRYAETSNVTFQDVKGIDSCKEELEELVGFLQNPQIFHDSGARLPKGILLTGRPGTGKTLMAKAIAGEAKVKFFYSSGSEFEEVFVGVGARRIRSLFAAAKEQAPCIIFIDELDSLGGKRKSQGQMESRQALNQLLVEMDGFQPTENVIVIAATNFPEALDSALKRPGRFDKTIEVPIPDYQGRLEILEFYLSKIAHSQSIQKETWAKKTIGMTGADIQNLVNMAILEAVKQGKEEASNQDIEVAFDRITLGVDFRNKPMTKEQKENTAIHEAGHVLASLLTEGAKKIHKATILPRGPSLGATHFIPNQDELNHTRLNLLAEIDVSMGGRAAEEVIFGIDKVTNGEFLIILGSSSDLKKATEYAYFALQNGLFNENVGLISGIPFQNMGAQQRDLIDLQCSLVLLDAYERIKQKLQKNKKYLTKLADQLLEKETLTEQEILELTSIYKLKE